METNSKESYYHLLRYGKLFRVENESNLIFCYLKRRLELLGIEKKNKER